MTEITVFTDDKESSPIRWNSFILALILAPIVVGILGYWAVIPVFAILFGAPTYLAFGTPAFILAIAKWKAGPLGLAFAGFLANLAAYPAVLLSYGPDAAEFVTGFGYFFAPLWGLTFGLLYLAFQAFGERAL